MGGTHDFDGVGATPCLGVVSLWDLGLGGTLCTKMYSFLLDLGFNALVWINVGLGARTCHALVRYHYVTWGLDLVVWYGQAPTFYS